MKELRLTAIEIRQEKELPEFERILAGKFSGGGSGNVFINFKEYMEQKYPHKVLNDNTLREYEYEVNRFCTRLVHVGVLNNDFKKDLHDFFLDITMINGI